jgi:prepilin-type N-terminal cleavage/methylation domain-containing protein
MARKRNGFTLVELIVATLVGAIGVAAAFAFARSQLQGYATQTEASHMQSSAQLVLEALARDVRNAGYGTSFWAGSPNLAFNGQMFSVDANGRSKGFPAVGMANNITTAGVMPGSDAISFLRILSNSTTLTPTPMPCSLNNGTGSPFQYTTDPLSWSNLTCLSGTMVDFPVAALLLVTDSSRPTGEPEGMLVAAASNPPPAAPTFNLANRFHITPGRGGCFSCCPPAPAQPPITATCPPQGGGLGSTVVCAQPVTYWLDDQGRLRMWRARGTGSTTDWGGTTNLCHNGGCGANWPSLPSNPNGPNTTDLVLAEGVEDLQFAFLMSNDPNLPGAAQGQWVTSPNLLLAPEMMSEVRVVRISAIVRTARAFQDNNGAGESRGGLLNLPGEGGIQMEDHVLANVQTVGCTTPGTCYDPRYMRRRLTFEAELRNMRIFDALSTNQRGYQQVYSYRY